MDKLAKSLRAAQMNMPPMEKDAVNPHFKSAFTSLDYIVTHARPVWTEAGLSVTQWPSFDPVSGRHTLTTRVMDAESGQSMEDQMLLNIGKDDMQGLGAAITYARRFALSSIFALATETDDDGNSTSKRKRSAEGTAEPQAGAAEKPQTSTSSAAPADGNTGFATEAQRKRLFALAKESNVDGPRLKEIVEQITGQGSTAQIPKALYDKVCVAVQTAELAASLADVPFE